MWGVSVVRPSGFPRTILRDVNMASKRKHREYEKTCNCRAYKFPHRMLGGRCEGLAIVINHYNSDNNDCADCVSRDDDYSCQVIEGREDTQHASCMQEFIRYEGIKPPLAWVRGTSFFNGARA